MLALNGILLFPVSFGRLQGSQLALLASGGSMSNTKDVDCSQVAFAYRRNGDGSIDSICRICYLTAATADNEAELHEREKDH
jgi:hypothetical protein